MLSSHVLLQHRAPWSHQGDTWGLPGGARDSHETSVDAALRETAEETGIEGSLVNILDEIAVSHGPWGYTTVIARAPSLLPVVACNESLELRWVPLKAVEQMDLHPGLRAALPTLQQRIAMLP
jgi:8-oxo-dGTP diphosphatase